MPNSLQLAKKPPTKDVLSLPKDILVSIFSEWISFPDLLTAQQACGPRRDQVLARALHNHRYHPWECDQSDDITRQWWTDWRTVQNLWLYSRWAWKWFGPGDLEELVITIPSSWLCSDNQWAQWKGDVQTRMKGHGDKLQRLVLWSLTSNCSRWVADVLAGVQKERGGTSATATTGLQIISAACVEPLPEGVPWPDCVRTLTFLRGCSFNYVRSGLAACTHGGVTTVEFVDQSYNWRGVFELLIRFPPGNERRTLRVSSPMPTLVEAGLRDRGWEVVILLTEIGDGVARNLSDFLAAPGSHTKLRLHLGDTPYSSMDKLNQKALGGHCGQLTHIALSASCVISFDNYAVLDALVRACPLLEVLDVGDADVCDAVLAVLGECCPCLTSFAFNAGASNITDEGIRRLVVGPPSGSKSGFGSGSSAPSTGGGASQQLWPVASADYHGCRRLRFLSGPLPAAVTFTGIELLSRGCPHLRSLAVEEELLLKELRANPALWLSREDRSKGLYRGLKLQVMYSSYVPEPFRPEVSPSLASSQGGARYHAGGHTAPAGR